MFDSSDLLRKKICVTVFLDELFEEVQEDAHDNSTRESREVDSGVKIREESPKKQVNVCTCKSDASDDFGEIKRPKTRPRKPIQQSKFGKSKNDSRSALGCKCCGGRKNEKEKSHESDTKSKLSLESISEFVTITSESIMTDESFLSGKGINSQKVDRGVDCPPKVLLFTKSTQSDPPDFEIKKAKVLLESKAQQTEENELVDFVLDFTDTYAREDNIGDEVKQYDLKSMLEDYVKMEECYTTQIHEVFTSRETGKNGLYIITPSDQTGNFPPHEVIRVWSTCKNVWSEGFESEMSEVDQFTNENKTVRYFSVVMNMNSTVELEKTKNPVMSVSDTKCSRLFRKSEECKQETKSAIFGVSGAEDKRTLEETKHRVIVEPPNKLFECRSKNFAEGDTLEEPSSQYVFQFETKENQIIRRKMLSQDTNEVVISKAKIQFLNSEILEKIPQHVSEVFVKKKIGSLDTESVTVFAESANDGENSQETHMLECEDTVSNTKLLKRMKTVDIFGHVSISDIKDFSTEFILYSEDVNEESIFMESWEGSAKSLSEMKEFCLKDSNESTMYVIEIPLHLIKTSRKKSSKTFKSTDSE